MHHTYKAGAANELRPPTSSAQSISPCSHCMEMGCVVITPDLTANMTRVLARMTLAYYNDLDNKATTSTVANDSRKATTATTGRKRQRQPRRRSRQWYDGRQCDNDVIEARRLRRSAKKASLTSDHNGNRSGDNDDDDDDDTVMASRTYNVFGICIKLLV